MRTCQLETVLTNHSQLSILKSHTLTENNLSKQEIELIEIRPRPQIKKAPPVARQGIRSKIVMCPHTQDMHGAGLLVHRVDQPML